MTATVPWFGRRAAFGLLFLLLSLGLGLHTFVADLFGTKTEVHSIRAKVHARLGDMHVGIELAPDGHDLALKRRRKRPQTAEVHDVAVSHASHAISAARLSTLCISM